MTFELPDLIENETQLDDVLTSPSDALSESISRLQSPLVILGAGGKMGPSLAVLAKRAAEAAGNRLDIIAASRFRNSAGQDWLQARGVQTRQVDVFDRKQLAELPDSGNIVYLVGMKFGTSTDPVPTWITNTLGPILAAERFAGAKFAALSTGNVYALNRVAGGGSVESDPLRPMGEYANAAVARERIFQHFAVEGSHPNPTALIRLNYAHDLRYGVLTDIAAQVWQQKPICLEMSHFNAIWQGDANEIILRAFDICSSPATALNLTSPDFYSVRETAIHFGQLLDRDPTFVGQEQQTALLSNAQAMVSRFGTPRVSFHRLLAWIAHWIKTEGTTLGKPTHFESRDGQF